MPCVKLGVLNCQSIGGKLDFVFDHIKEYQLDIVALTETWLSSEDSKNKHAIDHCVAHGYTLHHSPRTSGRRGYIGEQYNQGDLSTDPCKSSDYFIWIDGGCSYYLLRISTCHCNIPHALSKINGLKTGTFMKIFLTIWRNSRVSVERL